MKKLSLCVAFLMAACAAKATMELASPESQGVSSGAIVSWLDACERHYADRAGEMLHGFVLVRHGKTVAEGSWKPFDTLNETHMLYSHSKSFTSTAVGLAVDEGRLDLDERVIDIFTNERPAAISRNLSELRVRDLLTMNAGKKDHVLKDGGNWAVEFLAQDFSVAPGTRFRYDSDATYMLAAIVERRTGMGMMDYLKAKLFDRIGIEKAWTTCSPQGIPCGGWGMNMTTRELARFGQFLLQKGTWNGERLLSPDWIQLASARQAWSGDIRIQDKAIGSGSDWKQGYGFQFWRGLHGTYRADGAAGQLTVVMPDQDAVISVHAGLGDMQTELDLIWNHLLPAFAKAPLTEDPAACENLRRRCEKLALPTLVGTDRMSQGMLGAVIQLAENDRGLKSVRLDRAADGWLCKFVTKAGSQTVPVGFGSWQKGTMAIDTHGYEGLGHYIGMQHTAACGAVTAKGDFALRIYLTNATAHIDLTVSLDGDGKPVAKGLFWGMGGGRL